jgi:uncharacterized protein YbbK (DUF523 family)/uncharacterized protein YbgA (DUF1722 family)
MRAAPISIGVSACLLGEKVRYDGDHRRDHYISRILINHFNLIPYCPEMSIGLGVPRPAIQLIEGAHGVRLVDCLEPTIDHTDRMIATANEYCTSLPDSMAGYLVKARSPSCGLHAVNLFDGNGLALPTGIGLFTARLMRLLPGLPIEEDERLHEPHLRENFLERVFIFSHWRSLLADGIEQESLLRFHQRLQLSLLARNDVVLETLNSVLPESPGPVPEPVARRYITRIMSILSKPPTREGHQNVMRIVALALTKHPPAADMEPLEMALNQYRTRAASLSQTLKLIKNHLSASALSRFDDQFYLQLDAILPGLMSDS